jgi:quercetin dioxygenase-like cupin family protein
MWMEAGSYWTQPAGEVHITSSRGAGIGYVEIQSGPYLVKPSTEAFDNGEKPVNVDSTNIVWLDASDSTWIKGEAASDPDKNAQMTFMWGSPDGNQINGTMLKLPAGFSGSLESDSSTFKMIVIKGQIKLQAGGDEQTLTAGSYLGSQGKASHRLSCEKECTVYVRNKGRYSVVPE